MNNLISLLNEAHTKANAERSQIEFNIMSRPTDVAPTDEEANRHMILTSIMLNIESLVEELPKL